MASFFRWRIADKIIPLLVKDRVNEKYVRTSLISSFIRVARSGGPQLLLPWKKIINLPFQPDDLIDPKVLVTLLRNQGLPTAEGFTDITLGRDPLSILFTVDKHVYSKIVLTDICANDEIIAKSSCLFQDVSKKKIIINCSTPQIGETFHMDHFRSAIHSNFASNINKTAGHDVINVLTVADWGLSSAVLLIGYKQFGVESELLKHPSHHLSEVLKATQLTYKNDMNFKNQVQLCFDKMKQGNKEIISEWNYLKDLCIMQYGSIYDKIGLTFDETLFDSSYSSEIEKVQEELLNRKLISLEGDGQVKVNTPTDSDLNTSFWDDEFNPIVFNISRNIHSVLQLKNKHNFDELYYVNSAKEKDFLSILFSLLKELGFQHCENLHHIKLKNIRSVTGKQIDVENILNKAKSVMLNHIKTDLHLEEDGNIEQMAEALSFASLCIYDMKHRRNIEYQFSWKDILSFERESGISLQLCHAGLKGLQEDSEYIFNVEIDTSPLLETEAHDLVRHLSRFDEMVYKSYVTLEPCIILQYLFTLWHFVDKAANVLKLDIKSDRLTVLKARLLLLSAALKVLQKGLHLLGVTPYETNYSPPEFIKF